MTFSLKSPTVLTHCSLGYFTCYLTLQSITTIVYPHSYPSKYTDFSILFTIFSRGIFRAPVCCLCIRLLVQLFRDYCFIGPGFQSVTQTCFRRFVCSLIQTLAFSLGVALGQPVCPSSLYRLYSSRRCIMSLSSA